tara:strand:- start:3187 stop:3411 length:225 start_codon:yes stop_codon:yes gene_type:complete
MDAFSSLKNNLSNAHDLQEESKNPLAYKLQQHAQKFYTNKRIKDRLTAFILGFCSGALVVGSINICYHLFHHLH